jgi:hypothetical protein
MAVVARILPETGWGIKETVERCLACEVEGVATGGGLPRLRGPSRDNELLAYRNHVSAKCLSAQPSVSPLTASQARQRSTGGAPYQSRSSRPTAS